MSVSVKPVTFTTAEVCHITRISRGRLHELIKCRALRPFAPGFRGGGGTARFSAQQAYACCCISSLVDSPRGCPPAYARQIIVAFQKMSDSVLDEWWGEQRATASDNAYAEESVAAYLQDTDVLGVFGDHGNPRLASDTKTVATIMERCARVAEAIRIKRQLGQVPEDRVTKVKR
jgi:hypothetical protein